MIDEYRFDYPEVGMSWASCEKELPPADKIVAVIFDGNESTFKAEFDFAYLEVDFDTGASIWKDENGLLYERRVTHWRKR